jgi:hypothetical protein
LYKDEINIIKSDTVFITYYLFILLFIFSRIINFLDIKSFMIFKEIIIYLNNLLFIYYINETKFFLGKEFYHSCTSINVPKSISKSNIAKRNKITEKRIDDEFTKLRRER